MQLEQVTGDGVTPLPKKRRKQGPRRRPIDGRTRTARRVRELIANYLALLGEVSPELRRLVERAAQLVALAENARKRAIAGAGDLDDVVRIERLSDRAVRQLGIDQTKHETPHVPLRDQDYPDEIPEYVPVKREAPPPPPAASPVAAASSDDPEGLPTADEPVRPPHDLDDVEPRDEDGEI